MAKRARGSHRPGQRPPAPAIDHLVERGGRHPEHDAATDDPDSPGGGARRRARGADRGRGTSGRGCPSSHDKRRGPTVDPAPRETLALTAAEEYAYVGRDVRRITLIGGSLIVLLFILFGISQVTGAGPI